MKSEVGGRIRVNVINSVNNKEAFFFKTLSDLRHRTSDFYLEVTSTL
jgi:hypothetical protein